EERASLVAALAQFVEKVVRRDARASAALHRFDDDAARVVRKRPRILAVREAVHGPWEPGRERLAEALEPGSRKREQPRAVVRALRRAVFPHCPAVVRAASGAS